MTDLKRRARRWRARVDRYAPGPSGGSDFPHARRGTQVAPLSGKRLPPVRSLLAPCDGECKSVKEERMMIRLVVFLAIGVMGLILVRVRRQRGMAWPEYRDAS